MNQRHYPYRVCIVDGDLNQVTYWEWVGPDGMVSWPAKLVHKPVFVSHYLIHDTNIDAIGVCKIDLPMHITKYTSIELQVSFGTGWRYWHGATSASD